MSNDLNSPEVVASELDEVEAGLLVAHLTEHGIHAKLWGESNSAAWPDTQHNVQIVVRRGDKAPAEKLIENFKNEVVNVNWDDVDVGEPE